MTPDEAADLVARLRAQLDKDERFARVARGTGEGRWRYDGTAASGPTVATGEDADDRWRRRGNMSLWTCDDIEDGCHEIANQWEAEGEHIARQDPKRTLGKVAADRAILELHRPWVASSPHVVPPVRCRECGDIDEAPVAWPCRTVLLLAQAPAADKGAPM